MDVQSLRAMIPATRDMVYMNTGWAGPSPQPVLAQVDRVLREEARLGPASPAGLRMAEAVADEARSAVASLVHADPEDVVLTHGTTEGVNMVLHGLPWEPGDGLVTCDLEHPAIREPVGILEERYGVAARVVEVPPESSAQEMVRRIQSALDPRTRLVALSHIQYTCGLRMPMEEIAKAVHRAGALLLVDGAQTAGQVPLDVERLGADFYALSGQKWLLGPLGTGALFIKREQRERLRPLLTSREWAERLGREGTALASQSVALWAGLAEAVRTVTDLGLEWIEERCLALAQRLKGALSEVPGCTLTGPTPPELSCGLVSVAVESWEPPSLVERLWDRWRIVARAVGYPAGVRFSTAAFNTEEEVDRVAQAVAELASEGPKV